MKKLFTVAALVAVTSLGLAQGTVNFSAGATAATRLATNTVVGGPSTGLINGAGNYYFALFVAPSTVTASSSMDPTLSGFTFTGYYGTNTTSAGRMTGNPTTDDVAINGYATGTSASFMVLGWSSNIGTTWAQAQTWWNNGNPTSRTGFFGDSAVATSVGLGGGLSFPGNIFGAQPGQITGFNLGLYQVIPEPTTVALAGLGAAAMLIFRRRK